MSKRKQREAAICLLLLISLLGCEPRLKYKYSGALLAADGRTPLKSIRIGVFLEVEYIEDADERNLEGNSVMTNDRGEFSGMTSRIGGPSRPPKLNAVVLLIRIEGDWRFFLLPLSEDMQRHTALLTRYLVFPPLRVEKYRVFERDIALKELRPTSSEAMPSPTSQ